VTPISAVKHILLTAARLGLTDGRRAFIHLDLWTALNASSHLAMSSLFLAPSAELKAEANSSDSELLMTAAQALLIVKAHAVSLSNNSDISYKVRLGVNYVSPNRKMLYFDHSWPTDLSNYPGVLRIILL